MCKEVKMKKNTKVSIGIVLAILLLTSTLFIVFNSSQASASDPGAEEARCITKAATKEVRCIAGCAEGNVNCVVGCISQYYNDYNLCLYKYGGHHNVVYV